jgi:L-amino acid N-acyltransferase YncA
MVSARPRTGRVATATSRSLAATEAAIAAALPVTTTSSRSGWRARRHERCGFREVGVYREQGMLDGRWVDVVVMERLL